jgi:hypothetical protein
MLDGPVEIASKRETYGSHIRFSGAGRDRWRRCASRSLKPVTPVVQAFIVIEEGLV